jgi:hypothetical protein
MKRFLLFFLFFHQLVFAKWNNNYSFFSSGSGGNNTGQMVLDILSYLLIVFGVFLFLHSSYKLLGSNSPEDKTRGALLTNIFFLILSILFITNQYVLKKLLGL